MRMLLVEFFSFLLHFSISHWLTMSLSLDVTVCVIMLFLPTTNSIATQANAHLSNIDIVNNYFAGIGQRVHQSMVMGWWLVLLIINAIVGSHLRKMRWSITFYETQTKTIWYFNIFCNMCSTVQTINKFNSNKNWLTLLPKMSLN